MSGDSLGVQLMSQINTGELQFKQSDLALEIKEKVTQAMEEIITMGARVHPLKLNGKRVGWLRPLSPSERKILDSLIDDNNERMVLMLTHCTTLSESEIDDLDIYEINSILHQIYSANVADISLFPYISAFCSTQTSQLLWDSRRRQALEREIIRLPDGSRMQLLAPSSHLSLWALLTSIRVRSLHRLEEALNMSAIVRSQIGKDADKYVKGIISEINSFKLDAIEPWTDIVDYTKLQANPTQFNDGYGHSHEDGSVQGLLREMDGMMQGDKHEQLMQQFYEKQINEAKEKEQQVLQRVQKRRKELEILEDDGSLVVVTDVEVKRRQREIHSRTQRVMQQQIAELANQSDEAPPPAERITKYFEREK